MKTMKVLLVTSLGRCGDRLTAGLCTFRVIDRGKSEAHRRMEASRAHVQMERHLEFHLDCAYMGRATEDRESWMYGFSKGRWLIARDKECENAQRCVNVDELVNEMITSNVQALMVVSDQEVRFDQEASITVVKNTLTGELRSVGGSSSVSKESPMSASAANASIEKSVREMQITVRTIVAYIVEVYGTSSDPGGASSTWTVEIVGHVVSGSQSTVSDVKTACERRKRKSCRKALVKCKDHTSNDPFSRCATSNNYGYCLN